jgi:hypothetical protein
MIDAKIKSIGDWRGETLGRLRQLIREADPDVVEEIKWRKPSNPGGVPTWSHAGIVCTGETYKGKVKLTFARGAALPDPAGLFNASLNGGTMRAIDVGEGETVDADAFKALVRAAVALNAARLSRSQTHGRQEDRMDRAAATPASKALTPARGGRAAAPGAGGSSKRASRPPTRLQDQR